MNKYIFIGILILTFIVSSVITFYKVKSDKLEYKLEQSNKNYSEVLDKLQEQERSIKEYQESLKRQDDKLKENKEKSIAYEKQIEDLKKEFDNLNLKKLIVEDPEKAKVIINEKINLQFKEINELTK